jgi:hypothetical protein
VLLSESVQVIVDFVPPVASDLARAEMSVSGVSVNDAACGVPLLQLALWSTATDAPLELSMGLPETGFPFESLVENVARATGFPQPCSTRLVILIAPSSCVLVNV